MQIIGTLKKIDESAPQLKVILKKKYIPVIDELYYTFL